MDRISPDLEKNRQWVEETFQNCDDILHRQVFLIMERTKEFWSMWKWRSVI